MFKSLVKAVVGVVTLPVDIVADCITLGGAMTDKKAPYTYEKCKKIVDNIELATRPSEDDFK